MKMTKARVPDRLLTDEQKAYQKELIRVKREVLTMHTIAKNPALSTLDAKNMLRQALFQYNELIKNPPKRTMKELAQQPMAASEE